MGDNIVLQERSAARWNDMGGRGIRERERNKREGYSLPLMSHESNVTI